MGSEYGSDVFTLDVKKILTQTHTSPVCHDQRDGSFLRMDDRVFSFYFDVEDLVMSLLYCSFKCKF